MKYLNNIVTKGITVLMVVLLSMSSCNEDVLEEVPLDFLSTANLYSTLDEMNQAVFMLHERTRDAFYRSSKHQATVLGGLGADFCYDGENPAGSPWMSNWATLVIPTNDGLVLYLWEKSYRTIQYANVLIAAAEAKDGGDNIWKGNPEKKESIIAEAKFFRAFMYRMLVILYGDVPLLTEPVTTVKTDFTRADEDLVFDLIEEDLEFGALHLPGRGEEEQPGRITKGAANHLLSEIYLARGKWAESINAASVVIDGAGYALMKERFGTQLGNDDPLLGGGDAFYDLFRYGNQNLPENTEGIWVMQFQNDIDGGDKYGGERMWGPAYFRIGSDPAGKQAIIGDNPDATNDIYLSTFSRPVAWCKPTNYLAYDIWNSDWNNDMRNARHNYFRDWRYNNPDSPDWFGKPIDFVNDYPEGVRNLLNDTSQYIFPFPMKVASPGLHFTDPNRQGTGFNHVDRYIFRLAETLLIRAEAHLGNGNAPLAADDINTVRSRSNANPVAPGDVTIDYILDERARELYTESYRLLTLMRLGVLYDRTIKYMDNPVAGGGVGAGIQPHNNKFPIPQSEIDLNINGVLEQNPGY